jgi:hypothetical protein
MCNGRGTQSLHGAAITGAEMDELGDDFREDYVAGVYDHDCDHCGGSGTTTADAWEWHLETEAERRMGA